MLHALSSEHDFVVFAGAFDNPNPERIRFVRIPVIARPLAALFISYHFMARLVYWWYQLRNGVTFDVVQTNGTNFSIGDVAYAHFCHRAYLRDHWRAEGARSSVHRFMRYCDHRLHSAMESVVFRRAQKIVVPSHGLRRELESIYPASRGKITVISNAIDVESMRPPADHQRSLLRASLSYPPG
jgi:glycosyltransferase involved in cell wall biosynthesis